MLVKVRPLWQSWIARRIPPSPSLQLNQRRIFIIPSGQGVAFGVAVVLLLLTAINYQNSLAYGLTFLLLSLFIVAILHTYRNLGGLRLTALGALPVFVGEQVCFRVRLEGEGRERRAIGLGWSEQALQYADVRANGAEELLLTLPAERRGWLRPGRLRVESRFPLGLLVAWSWLDLDQAGLVYPRPLPADLPLEGGRADEHDEGLRATGSGADDFQGLRPYQSGDSRRRLHWKAYSRGQGLLVKDFAALRRAYRSFVIPATVAFLAWYLLYVLMSNYATGFMSHELVGNINVALVFGLLQFVTTFLIAWLYARYSIRKLDPLARQLDDEYRAER